jgi:uncharacterized membrane protein
MNLMPDPLHPAVVHFPVVLIVLGTAAALLAVFWRKGYVPAFAAVLLGLGALGAWAAVQTGKSDGGLVESQSSQVSALLDAHEHWAERTLTLAAIAAFAAVASTLLVRFPRAARGVAVAAALVAGAASWSVYETGHRGGALVFQFGTGVAGAATAGVADGQLEAVATAAHPETGTGRQDHD